MKWAAIKGAQESVLRGRCSVFTAARVLRDFEQINGVAHDHDGHRSYTDHMGPFRAPFERARQLRNRSFANA
jgi:hypothetical protein